MPELVDELGNWAEKQCSLMSVEEQCQLDAGSCMQTHENWALIWLKRTLFDRLLLWLAINGPNRWLMSRQQFEILFGKVKDVIGEQHLVVKFCFICRRVCDFFGKIILVYGSGEWANRLAGNLFKIWTSNLVTESVESYKLIKRANTSYNFLSISNHMVH